MPAQKSSASGLPVPVQLIERRIYLIRGQKVMIDTDLAELYGVPTKVFNQAVKRNIGRFPADFMFQLNYQEVRISRSQIVTLKRGQNIKYLPHAFTEQGVAMLSSVLNGRKRGHSIFSGCYFKRIPLKACHSHDGAGRLSRQLGRHFQAG